MPSIPFTAYDIFAYLSSGFVVIGAADFAFPGTWILNAELSVIEGLVWIVVAYVLGHVISAVSAPILEQRFAERTLGYREEVLFDPQEGRASSGSEKGRPFERFFPGYFNRLPKEIQMRVLARAKEEAEITSVGTALFLYCDARVRQKPEAAPVLATFLNIYGFARNACLACSRDELERRQSVVDEPAGAGKPLRGQPDRRVRPLRGRCRRVRPHRRPPGSLEGPRGNGRRGSQASAASRAC